MTRMPADVSRPQDRALAPVPTVTGGTSEASAQGLAAPRDAAAPP
jgi:hypothetical protein